MTSNLPIARIREAHGDAAIARQCIRCALTEQE